MFRTAKERRKSAGSSLKSHFLWVTLHVMLSFQTQIKNITDRTLNVAFSRFRVCLFTITRPEAETQTISAIPLSCHSTVHVRYSLGLCLRVIVKENPQNLEKTTYNVLSVILLIYGFNNMLTPISIQANFSGFIACASSSPSSSLFSKYFSELSIKTRFKGTVSVISIDPQFKDNNA